VSIAPVDPKELEKRERAERALFSTVLLTLRLGLGIALIQRGVLGYLIQYSGGRGMITNAWMGGPASISLLPQVVFPAVDILLGVMLTVGFYVRICAFAASIVMLIRPVLATLEVIVAGQSPTTFAIMSFQQGSVDLLQLIVAGLLQLGSFRGLNRLSLDALVFPDESVPRPPRENRRRADPAKKPPPPDPFEGYLSAPDRPAAPPSPEL
jgi:uncharacterized membrane protein YphA (DoxX/SURF4 family)